MCLGTLINPCCSLSSWFVCGQYAKRYAWFSPLVAFFGCAWIFFGWVLFFSELNEVRTSLGQSPKVLCYFLASIGFTYHCARAVGETLCRFYPQMSFFFGVLAFVAAFVIMPQSTETLYLAYALSCPLFGGSVALMSVGIRCVTIDPRELRSKQYYTFLQGLCKALCAMMAAVTGFYALKILNWHWIFYIFAVLSALVLPCVTYFFVPENPATLSRVYYRCPSISLKLTIVAFTELVAGGVRWSVPLFTLIYFDDLPSVGALGVALVFGTFFAALALSAGARALLVRFTESLGFYSYIVSGIATLVYCVWLPRSTSQHSIWTLCVFAGLFGFDIDWSEQFVRRLLGEEFFIQTSSILSLFTAASVLFWTVFLADYTSHSDIDTAFDYQAAACVLPILTGCYSMLVLASPKTYSPLVAA